MRKHPVVIALAFKDAPPATVDAGSAFSFSVVLTWPKGLNPEGASYVLREAERNLQTGTLPKPNGEDGSIALTLRAPDEPGEHLLVLIVTSTTQEGHEPAEGVLPFALTTVPHETSLAVWDIPSPVVRNARFEIKAGAKCSASCGLRRQGHRNPRRAGQTDRVGHARRHHLAGHHGALLHDDCAEGTAKARAA